MKTKNKLITIVIAVILTAITCIPIFASNNTQSFLDVPSDLGTYIGTQFGEIDDTVHKYYLVLTNKGNGYGNIDFPITYRYDNDDTITTETQDLIYASAYYRVDFTTIYTYTSFCMIPKVIQTGTNTLYIPIYCRNIETLITTEQYNNISQYYTWQIWSSLATESEIVAQAYQTGYIDGYAAGQNSEEYTNITGYVTQLLTQFVGSDSAQYITPIAIVLVILFVYFLFIRFLLSLIKAKGVIKTCDIIMIVACIILLVVMYAPMLNLTIRTEQITTETTESTQVRRIDYVYDEYGRIISGPGGTVIYDEVESTTSEHEQTEVEVTTQPIEKEITTYEETKENIIRS